MNPFSLSRQARRWLALVLLAAAARGAHADLTPVAQNRRISISGQATDTAGMTVSTNHLVVAPDFGLFDGIRGVALNAGGEATADGLVSQRSLIELAGVTVDSLADANASAFDPDPFDPVEPTADVGGSSNFLLTFDLGSAESWRLEASGLVFDSASVLVELRLGATVLATWDPSSTPDPLDETLLLAPGRYDLLAEASASGFAGFGSQGSGRAELSLRFQQVNSSAIPEAETWLGAVVLLAGAALQTRRLHARRN